MLEMCSGFSIKSYSDGESIPLFLNKVYSDHTQLQFAYAELPFVCAATGRKSASMNLISGSSVSLNLGEILRGDRIVVSDYELTMLKDNNIHKLCSKQVDRASIAKAQEVIADGYVAEWIVDNLPSATSFVTVDRSRKYYAAGFKLGYLSDDAAAPEKAPRYFLNNHVTIVIRYHTAPGKAGKSGKKVIVGFEVFPKSIGLKDRDDDGLPRDVHNIEQGFELCMPRNDIAPSAHARDPERAPVEGGEEGGDDGTTTIPYTYSVYFREEEGIEWHNRWDLFFINQEDSSSIHWLAIVNSLVIAGLLAVIVAVILARTIRGEIMGHKEGSVEDGRKRKPKAPRSPRGSVEKGGVLDTMGDAAVQQVDSSDDEEVEDITGWKLVHTDVFRAPLNGELLAPLIGSGSQLVFMASGLLLLSCSGILNPSFRGGFESVGVGLFLFAGLVSGYFSARIYKTIGGQLWKKNVLLVGCPVCAEVNVIIDTIFVTDRLPSSGPSLHHDLHPQPLCLGTGLQHSAPLLDSHRSHRAVGFHSTAACLYWQLVWLQLRWGLLAPHQSLCDPSPNPAIGVADQRCADNCTRGLHPLRCHLRRAALRVQKHLAGQNRLLLRVRLHDMRCASRCSYCR